MRHLIDAVLVGCIPAEDALEEVPEGAYTLSLYGSGYRHFSQELTLTPGMEPLALTIQRLPRIRGRLLGFDGAPITNAPFQFFLAHLGSSRGFDQGTPEPTNAEGLYEVAVRQPGTYSLTLIVPEIGYARSGEVEVNGAPLFI